LYNCDLKHGQNCEQSNGESLAVANSKGHFHRTNLYINQSVKDKKLSQSPIKPAHFNYTPKPQQLLSSSLSFSISQEKKEGLAYRDGS